jgi:hypothetical protein
MNAPNPRLQRTPLRAPLSRKPLGSLNARAVPVTRARLYVALFLSLAAAAVSCSKQEVSRYAIEVTGPDTLQHKLERAQAIATYTRLVRLQEQVQRRLPSTTDAQLQGLALRSSQDHYLSFKDGSTRDTITVVILVRHAQGFDPEPMLAVAREILEPEVNPAFADRSGGQP